jgi:hypothetical protein
VAKVSCNGNKGEKRWRRKARAVSVYKHIYVCIHMEWIGKEEEGENDG